MDGSGPPAVNSADVAPVNIADGSHANSPDVPPTAVPPTALSPTAVRLGRFSNDLATTLAGVLLILALGLPWSAAGAGEFYTGTTYAPGFCYTSYGYDGYASTNCDAGTLNPGVYYPGTSAQAAAGRSHPARFGVVGALALAAIARWRRNSRLLLPAGVLLAVVTGLSGGLAITQAGVIVAWLAAGLLAWAGASARRVAA
jgi:hypothetical protein